ncbi:MAG TPA: NAD(P)-dependent oxidoreductase [Polyangiaceae bacterium]|nr:NAD(P)-dependent oxidoreductase [Polyangiaceae bacterium]
MPTDGGLAGAAPSSTRASTRELWFTGPRAVEIRAGRLPALRAGQVVARALASGVSQGTELLLYRGQGPTPFDPSLDPAGAATYPRRYGYAWVGEVVECGPGLPAASVPAVGSIVFALAPHGDRHVLEGAAVRTLDRAIPPARAVLAANLETAITCVWDANVSLGDRVVVLGGGVVGLLVARLATASGGQVRLVEPSTRRRALAIALGIAAVSPEQDEPCADADVVVEATGDPRVLDRAVAHAAREAAVVVASFYGARTAPVALGADFHRRRLRLVATQVSSLPPAHAPRWSFDRRFDLVRTLLADPALDALIDPPCRFEEAASVYQSLDRSPGDAVQTLFEYE